MNSTKSFLPFLIAVIAGLLCVGNTASGQILITNFTTSDTGTFTLAWTQTTTNYIVEQRGSLVSDDWQYVDPVVATNVTTVDNVFDTAFFRIQEIRVLDIPDPNFDQAIRYAIPAKHAPTDQIYDIDVAPITELLYLNDSSISNLTGVLELPNLKTLNCPNNSLMNIDLTSCTNLQNLYCGNNNLTNLELTGCVNLQILFCNNNNLTGSLDISTCTNLNTVDVTGNSNLTDIVVWDTNNLPLPPTFNHDPGVNVHQ